MQKVLGSHKVKGKNGGSKTAAVLECGHEVDYGAVKWPGGMADCAKTHDDKVPVIVTQDKEKHDL